MIHLKSLTKSKSPSLRKHPQFYLLVCVWEDQSENKYSTVYIQIFEGYKFCGQHKPRISANHLVQFIFRSMYHSALSNNPTFIQCRIQFLTMNRTNNPPMQNQQINKITVYLCCMIKYSTRIGVTWQIQHLTLPNAVFATQPHPEC